MAATITRGGGLDKSNRGGEFKAVIALAETNQLKTQPGRCCKLIIWVPAAGGLTVDLYDHDSANNNRFYSEVIPASTFAVRELHVPLSVGLRVVTSALAGSPAITVTYS